ncbi:nuclear transport factor 2 family protein [Thalassotalea nanhaiensis]|uniref:Nuclear transport factor 2 family protein n=1 Tax=Thalassotalea nanhaiensis TaxID=3065648 RepID=A0ABY9TMD5_9GAMM|nr:nuclear transport factor 2 family protein [Colwelliaceae bacterium SQ345]
MKIAILLVVKFLVIAAYAFSLPVNANESKNTEVTKPINQLFDAMRTHDRDLLLAQFTANAMLQRIQPNGEVKQSNLISFADSIAKSTKYLDEKLLAVQIQQQGNMASVWTPFAFYLDKKLSHCGVNSFQLVKTEQGWKIQYLIDNTYQGDCNAFIASFKK